METQVVAISIGQVYASNVVSLMSHYYHRYSTGMCGMYHSSVGGCGDSQTSCHPQEIVSYRYISHLMGVVFVYIELPPAPVAVHDEVVLPPTSSSCSSSSSSVIPTEPNTGYVSTTMSHTISIDQNVAYETRNHIPTAGNVVLL